MSVQQRRQYDLAEEPDRSVRDVAESLGISVDLLYQWRRQYRNQGEIAFPGQGYLALTSDQKRIRDPIHKDGSVNSPWKGFRSKDILQSQQTPLSCRL